MKFYEYPKCSTCRKARKWLDAKSISYETVHLVEATPSRDEIEALWRESGLPLKKFFNTSGGSYRALDLKDRYAALSDDERLDLLSADGMLIKRPILRGDGFVLVGFREADYDSFVG